MKPMLKYRGGKQGELKYLEKWIPESFDRYIEPFFGGGALYFSLEPDRAIIGDVNKPLMEFYEDVAGNFDRLQCELGLLQALYEANRKVFESRKLADPESRVKDDNEDLYCQMRRQFNGLEPSSFLRGTLYFFLNKTAYSGMVRYNAKGEFNVPYGRYKHFNTSVVTREHSKLLSSAKRMNTDFSEVLSLCNRGDFVFIDPPYDCAFSDYGNGTDFSERDHERLADTFFSLPCKALMVVGSSELTERLYGASATERYFKNYAVNIRGRFKSSSEHMLVVNSPRPK